MHGRRRNEYKARLADPKMAAGLAQKAEQWNVLMEQLLKKSLPPPQQLTLTEKLLLVNPDPMVLYNIRRNLLLQQEEEWKLQPELSLTTSCLERNPKSYGAWFHRKWCLVESSETTVEVLHSELELCTLFLKKDERNFHCWNYRRFVVGLLLGGEAMDGSWDSNDSSDGIMGPQVVAVKKEPTNAPAVSPDIDRSTLIQAEWDFTCEKIQENFSNYSALHYRSKLISMKKERSESLLQEELELVHNAIFTEPDDQTAWWYFRFLLVQAFTPTLEVLQEERELLMELNEAEEYESKWAWLGLNIVLTEMLKQKPADSVDIQTQVNECLDRVMDIDPDRAARYVSMKQQQQV